MPTPPSPPDVSGVGPGWYETPYWMNTLVPATSNAELAYSNAQTAVSNFIASPYTADYNTLETLLNNPIPAGSSTSALQAAYNALLAAQNAFNVDQQHLTFLLNNLSQASTTLVAAQSAEELYVNSLGNNDYETYYNQLENEIGTNLTLAAEVPEPFATELTTANNTYLSTGQTYLSALSTFQGAEHDLTNARILSLSYQNQHIVAQATSLLQYYQTGIDTNSLEGYQANLLSDIDNLSTSPMDPRINQLNIIYGDVGTVITDLNAVTQDLSTAPPSSRLAADRATLTAAEGTLTTAEAALPPPPGPPLFPLGLSNSQFLADFAQISSGITVVVGDQSTLQTDQSVVTSFASLITSQAGIVQADSTARNHAQTALQTAYTNYISAINGFITVLTSTSNLAETSPNQFITDLTNAQELATTLQSQALQASVQNNTTLYNAHYVQWPTVNPFVEAAEALVYANAQNDTSNLLNQALANPLTVVQQINFPTLPTGASLSIGELMAFIGLVEVMLEELIAALRRSDDNVNALRFKLFGISSGRESTADSISDTYEDALEAADNKYNFLVADSNALNSSNAVNAVNQVIAMIPQINAVITSLNTQIAAQNSRGINVVTDLNSSNQIGADTQNQLGLASPQAYNEYNIQNEDTNTTFPSSVGIPAQYPAPLQLQPLPLMVANRIQIPSSLPTTLPVDVGDIPAANDEPTLPTGQDVDIFNQSIAYIDNILEPLMPRLQAAGINLPLIDPLYIRAYIPVRQPSDVIPFGNLFGFVFWFLAMVLLSEGGRGGTLAERLQSLPTDFFDSIPSLAANTQPIGGNVAAGTLGTSSTFSTNNLFEGAGNLGESLVSVLGSSDFQVLFGTIISQAVLLGGIAGLSGNAPPTSYSYADWTQQGVVDDAQATSVDNQSFFTLTLTSNEPAPPTYPNGLPVLNPGQTAAAGTTTSALVTAANNVPLLQQGILSLLQTQSNQQLDQAQIQQLISILLYIIQLLSLLIAALVTAAAGGQVNIDNIVQQAFPNTGTPGLNQITSNLSNLGVANLPTVSASNAQQFYPQYFNALAPELSSGQLATYQTEASGVFAQYGITLSSGVPLGTAISNGLAQVTSPTELANITAQLNPIAASAGNLVQGELINNPNDNQQLAGQVQTANTQLYNTLSTGAITTAQNTLSQVSGYSSLSQSAQQTLTLALATGTITQAQLPSFVNTYVEQSATTNSPEIGFLLGLEIQSHVEATGGTTVPTAAPTVASTTPGGAPVQGSTATLPGTPGNIPDANALLVSALQNLSNQTTDTNFTASVVNLFADSVRDQTDFFALSLQLILSPSDVFLKNFSIRTFDKFGGGSTTSLQIPISG